ncbi:class I SAM-dependent methyltransferase [Fictibacillus terranigra]|uniref:Class I SAM-dependent methyltransferase n=1 Tax=Fictibacillus terranigra TaxID=3058424 RepID=A0ABT8EB83_9BACL|nr:class I SAM-dependent methyltransferase [Fictibacillus sp. CENA-BCM004]MDN4075156.1 class I SAM-dependent methyltransferase [Fictibacillus sp. CENA-BCM004]
MRQNIFEQFEKPEGLLGKLAGKIMSSENKELNEWTISALQPGAGDRLLEVGYGPGVGIEYVCSNYPSCRIVGYDVSHVMKKQAESRNDSFIKEGRVELFEGPITSADEHTPKFDGVYTVNSIFIWKDPIGDLKKIKSLMKEQARIAVTLQPHEKGADDDTTKEIGRIISLYLKEAGFSHISASVKNMRPVDAVIVTAAKPV